MAKVSKRQLPLPGMAHTETYVCPICKEEGQLFGQFAPHLPWFICRECSIKHPYPVDLFIPSTRRNSDKNPLMIDPSPELSARRDYRIEMDELIRCAVDPSRRDRPVVKLNISGLEVMNPVRRSRQHVFRQWSKNADHALTYRQISMPLCPRCGSAHTRSYEMLPGMVDYWTHCQRCADEISVESLHKLKGIFGGDDAETVMDRLYASHRDLFERGVLPDYWFKLEMTFKGKGDG